MESVTTVASNPWLETERYHLFGEAWSEIPGQMITELSLALEEDVLEASDAHQLRAADPKPTKVLIHWVRQEDTIPGISLKYGINVEFLRRFNRLWPCDRRPLRPFIFIPVSLAPRLKFLLQEYPELFYEVHTSSLHKLSAALTLQSEAVMPDSAHHPESAKPYLRHAFDSVFFGRLIFVSSAENSTPIDPRKDCSPRPILSIPNCQLKYFPPSIKPKGVYAKGRTFNTNGHAGPLEPTALKPLFSAGTLGPFTQPNLPNELAAQFLVREPGFSEGKLPTQYMDRNQLFPKKFDSRSPGALNGKPASSKEGSEFEMTLLSRPSTPI
ncbi:hypothetical protein L0F63_006164 [Massospora cicadina]|nr:hypothetical protein L0F63_006164 [Massospora cicadina]